MFGMGMSEILVILVVALIFLGPEKLPGAAKSISKGIRDLRKQTREIQSTIENDEHIGGAIRDLRSALRGDELPARPKIKPPDPAISPGATPDTALPPAPSGEAPTATARAEADAAGEPDPARSEPPSASAEDTGTAAAPTPAPPTLTLPAVAGEATATHAVADDPADLAALVRPVEGTVAKGS